MKDDPINNRGLPAIMNVMVVMPSRSIHGLMLVASISFEPREPYKAEIMIATILRCTLIALVTGFSSSSQGS
jgi:hypothetical protein